MPPKFRKSTRYLWVSPDIETEVIDAYSETMAASGQADFFLGDISKVLELLEIPLCFTRDISQCIDWFYTTRKTPQMAHMSVNWPIADQLLRHLTISAMVDGEFDVSDIVDLDKLVKFCCRLVKFRDSFALIEENWALFIEASRPPENPESDKTNRNRGGIDSSQLYLTLQDLVRVKSSLQLDDVSDSFLIDMLGCGQSTVDGDIFNYKLPSTSVPLQIGIKDFAEVLGWLGHYDS